MFNFVKNIRMELIDFILSNNENDGIEIISLVKKPAVDVDFIKLSKESKPIFFADEKRKMIIGCSLRANYPIYRKPNENFPDGYYLQFSPKEIEKLVFRFMKNGETKKVNINHNENRTAQAYLVESFFLTDFHKLEYPQLSDLELGSWITSYKVEDNDVWDKIEKGEINGFSVEIINEQKLSKENELTNIEKLLILMKI